ncbi:MULTISPECIES: LPS export ABC transporter permease LptF [Pseudoxanthomonas]|jgi:lipopolysaccharide export system permease protein|uniref:Lipopolysaccharide export system permease protein LptF n=1 Tax=Pseudoxanthomonas winnipegensis TaxID=2480810 RepID=A0A4Q8LGW7_9GAMM|nr:MULTISPECIES: LPS export ABC transporter permease LptF [Pseudoxanthomonas]PZP60869.1 MAG: LPS export ABC transporter permease LptF [Pseudoxanthomonas spadix]TAA28730.1 LPS export ABC transporter permease LptF [Pseudoxanthomonas winnipegensis]TMN17333.1 LPS export ABC transporter permease LptF [Pseudoxanthomonas sp. X-1]UAY74123.1 LPS export ABC transporter permease LptF [Pseudoxanthomonas sp. X-1]
MPKLDRYLFSEFTQSFLAALMVLLIVSMGGLLVDVLGDVANGKLPAGLLLSQLGLATVQFLPLILSLALMLGLMLAIARLYRDSEMAVLTSIGVGPRRLLRPLLLLVVPIVAIVAAVSLWAGPLSLRTSQAMIDNANRSLILAGLEPGQFTVLSDGGVVYVNGMSSDGTRLAKVFMQRQKGDRLDVVTAKSGRMYFEGETSRFLKLEDGYRVEGPAGEGKDYRLMRYASNEVALPDGSDKKAQDDPELLTTGQLLGDARPEANAQLQSRITPPLLCLAFALLTLPLARSAPRQSRYGRVMLGFLGYLVAFLMMINGSQWLATGKLPGALGLWWLSLPLLALGVWAYLRDGRLSRPKGARA